LLVVTLPCVVVVEDLVRGMSAHVVATVASAVLVGDESGVGFDLERAHEGEVPAVKGWPPVLLEYGALERSHTALWLGERIGILSCLSHLEARVSDEGAGHVLGAVESATPAPKRSIERRIPASSSGQSRRLGWGNHPKWCQTEMCPHLRKR
jgi:hypothetical protein